MSRLSAFLLLGVLAVGATTVTARRHVYEKEWNTGVPGVTGHSVLIVQDGVNAPSTTKETDQDAGEDELITRTNLLTWANRQFEILARMQREAATNEHAIVLVNGVPMHVVIHTDDASQTGDFQDDTAFTQQVTVRSDEQEFSDEEYNYTERPEKSYIDGCIWRVMIVSLMVACACTFCACVKHACEVRKATIKIANKKAIVAAEKVPLLTVLAPEGMAKEPAVIHVTSADVVAVGK